MRVLITGITGQDGSYLVDRLVAEGAELHGAIRDWDADAHDLVERHPGLQLHVADLATEKVADLVTELAPDEVYNLGGISSVAQSWNEPALTGAVTGVAVARILAAAFAVREAGHDIRILQASSSEIFGEPDRSPQDESTPVAPTSPYGAAKAYAHNLIGMYRARGLFAASCILYNHESPRRPETFVTRKITASAARISAGLQQVLELGNLDVARDWGWAPDYVDAMVLAIRHDRPSDFVVASSTAHTVREFAAAAFATAGVDDWEQHVAVNPAFVRPTEITTMLGDPSRARKELGWTPSVDFDELVARMTRADLELVAGQRG
jgi:GDPmannose 4,6-dehydratase